MPGPDRRRFLQVLAALGASGLVSPGVHASTRAARLVVVGGGFGGATAARFLKRLLPTARVTLIEPSPRYVACPFSNLVIAGQRSIDLQTFTYDALQREGIRLVRSSATAVDPLRRVVALQNTDRVTYDRLVLSPGIEFRWNALPGYDEPAPLSMPHAWKAGPQTLLLQSQLQAMPENGTVAIVVPPAPFRCPPGPYERASLIAAFLASNKPRAKLLILDSNERFSKQALFQKAWRERYNNLIEWRPPTADGLVRQVDPANMNIQTDFESIRVDVANVIPPQQAGQIAQRAGATDETGWCPISPVDFSSALQPDIHLIGDATIAAPMPKSAFSANAQAKVCAMQISRELADLNIEPTTLANTCYSFIEPGEAISVSGVYRVTDNSLATVRGAGGTTPATATRRDLADEARAATDWFGRISGEAFG